jgi:ribosomal protein S17
MTHKLKTWPEYFEQVENRAKTFEIRKNDRNFNVGDILELEEFEPANKLYTGRIISVIVTYILDKQPFVPEGYVCMAIYRL